MKNPGGADGSPPAPRILAGDKREKGQRRGGLVRAPARHRLLKESSRGGLLQVGAGASPPVRGTISARSPGRTRSGRRLASTRHKVITGRRAAQRLCPGRINIGGAARRSKVERRRAPVGGTEAPEERQTRGPAVTKFAGAGREAGPARVLILNRGPAFIGGLFSPDYGEGSSRGTSGEFGYARARAAKRGHRESPGRGAIRLTFRRAPARIFMRKLCEFHLWPGSLEGARWMREKLRKRAISRGRRPRFPVYLSSRGPPEVIAPSRINCRADGVSA